MLKKGLAIFSCLGALVMFSVWAYAHCHNDGRGPETNTQVRGTLLWPASRKIPSTHIYEIPWRLNTRIYNNRPGLSPDATDAADAWSAVEFENKLINFQFKYDGITNLRPENNSDSRHVVGYANLGPHNRTIAYCYPRASGNTFWEFDIVLNYYKPFKKHGNWTTPLWHCLLEVLTHEFGHAAGLDDVYFKPHPVPVTTYNAPDRAHYTMNGTFTRGTHFRESLACEDKYALRAKYGDRSK